MKPFHKGGQKGQQVEQNPGEDKLALRAKSIQAGKERRVMIEASQKERRELWASLRATEEAEHASGKFDRFKASERRRDLQEYLRKGRVEAIENHKATVRALQKKAREMNNPEAMRLKALKENREVTFSSGPEIEQQADDGIVPEAAPILPKVAEVDQAAAVVRPGRIIKTREQIEEEEKAFLAAKKHEEKMKNQ